jgi:hypothetical protein
MRLVDHLRGTMGEHPHGVILLRAARVAAAVVDGAAGHKAGCGCVWCQVSRASGESSPDALAHGPDTP